MPLWVSSSGNLIVGDSGKPLSCDECPCKQEVYVCYINVSWGGGEGRDLDISVRYRSDNIGWYAGSKKGTYLNYSGAPNPWSDCTDYSGDENVPVNAKLLVKEGVRVATINVGASWYGSVGSNNITVKAEYNGYVEMKTGIHVSAYHNERDFIPPNIATVTFDFISGTVSVR